MIRFDDVTKQYAGGTIAVDELDLEAPTGQITVLVGPSGLRQDDLAAHGQPDDRAHLRARSRSTARTPAQMDAAELRRGIGYVIQHAGLFPHRTVLDNVATVPLLLGWDKKQTRDARAWSCSSASASTRRSPSATPPSSPAASSSGSASPGRWRPTRR